MRASRTSLLQSALPRQSTIVRAASPGRDDKSPSVDPNRIPALAHTPTPPSNIAFPDKLIQKGEVTAESWVQFASTLAVTLQGLAPHDADARLAPLIASLQTPAQSLTDMSPVERNRWASDRFRTMAEQCAALSRKVGRSDTDFADFAAVLGELMTELKRQTLLSSVSGEMRNHGKTAAANLVGQCGVDDVMRPMDAMLRSNSLGVTAGGGHNWIAKAVATLTGALGSERRFSFEGDSDGNYADIKSLGIGASVKLGLNALLASLDLSVGGSTTYKHGSFTVAPTITDMSAALVKAKHDEAPRTLPIVGRSASPTAREWAARYQRTRNGLARIASGFKAWAPADEPYWLSKTSNGFNTARVRELLESLNERANWRLPPDQRDAIAAMASKLFPLESEIRATLGPLGSRSVEEIRAIKNGGDDVYAIPAAPTDDVTGRRRKNHMRSVEASITASARAGSDYVPIGLAAKAGVGGTVGYRHIDVQRVQHDLLNLVGIDSTGDPATAYRVLSSVQGQLETIVRAHHARLGIDSSEQPAMHPYLALLHGTEPWVSEHQHEPDHAQAQEPRSKPRSHEMAAAGRAGSSLASPMLDLYGRYPDMPARHRQVLQSLLEGAMSPADLLRHVEAAYESLYEVACQLHEDTEGMQSTSPERRAQAVDSINHQVFAGGYDVPSTAETKDAKVARATLASHAHNALSLAVWNLSLYQMMAKESFAERQARAPLGAAEKAEWTASARRVDERYLQLKETVVDPLQANRLETTHRLSPVVAKAPCQRSFMTVTANLSIGSDGLLDMATHRVPGMAGTLLGGLPDGPSLGAGGAIGVTMSDTFGHPNLLKCGHFVTTDGSLSAPAGTGLLTDVIGRLLSGVRDDQGFGKALAFASGGVVTDAVEDIVKRGDLHSLLTRSPGANFQVQTRMAPAIGSLQPKPGVQYALLGTTEKKGFSASLPNLLALTPWTQNGVF
ncbi:MAG: hypothetical protein JWQ11_703, partial [Rhizobacter sp.]|nr:hypothetical protein [Rhizobacter sp.]